jgi:hypothetical protein
MKSGSSVGVLIVMTEELLNIVDGSLAGLMVLEDMASGRK